MKAKKRQQLDRISKRNQVRYSLGDTHRAKLLRGDDLVVVDASE